MASTGALPDVTAQPVPVAAKPASRLGSVDLLRGLVMVVMVLDHVRDFVGDMTIDATDLSATTVPLFLTRWITHFCAPTFVLLAGTGGYLAGMRGKTKGELSWFLLSRGLWLVFLEVSVMRLAMAWSLDPSRGAFIVIWAIGWSMVVLALLVHLPVPLIAAFGVAMCVLHNATDGVAPEVFGRLAWLWRILHAGGVVSPWPGARYFVLYPLVPWIGVMACGYALGAVYTRDAEARRKILLGLGLGLMLAFVAVRGLNVYGDPNRWSVQSRGPVFTVLSFLNCQKYPPSLDYLLMTLGPAIFFLGLIDRGVGAIGAPLITLGRVPLFFYIIQWPLAHGMGELIARFQGRGLGSRFGGGDDAFGLSLPYVYLAWIVALLILYFPCKWFAGVKKRNRSAWLSYF